MVPTSKYVCMPTQIIFQPPGYVIPKSASTLWKVEHDKHNLAYLFLLSFVLLFQLNQLDQWLNWYHWAALSAATAFRLPRLRRLTGNCTKFELYRIVWSFIQKIDTINIQMCIAGLCRVWGERDRAERKTPQTAAEQTGPSGGINTGSHTGFCPDPEPFTGAGQLRVYLWNLGD